MKLTPKLKRFLDKQFRLYCKKMKVKDITVYYDNEAFNRLHTYASSCATDREIYINIEHHDTVWGLIDTIVHELVHIKYPKLKHGNRFQNKINNIIIS